MSLLTSPHGQLKCGTVLVNDIDQAVAIYSKSLSFASIEETEISPILAGAWGAPRLSGAQCHLLQPSGGDESTYSGSYLRLIQSPEYVKPVPHATTYGWCAFELNVIDVFALAESLTNSEFNVVGAPKRMDGISSVIPMQVVGPDQEVFYLNQVLASTDVTDLPMANHTVDQFFIAVLASADIETVVNDYRDLLALDTVDTHDIRYSLINRAFSLDASTTHRLSVVQAGRRPLVEVDQYPEQASPRPLVEGSLPLGNAMVSIMVKSLNELPLTGIIGDIDRHAGHLYGGSRSVVLRGRSQELIELIEY